MAAKGIRCNPHALWIPGATLNVLAVAEGTANGAGAVERAPLAFSIGQAGGAGGEGVASGLARSCGTEVLAVASGLALLRCGDL